jgi:hypothetical protein
MTHFDRRAKEFQRNVSRAAAWMERRNAGDTHWWKSWVLTKRHTQDPDPRRPIVDDETARRVFNELRDRKLLVGEDLNGQKLATDEPDYPVYLMSYDRAGWDKAVTDGRPIYGQVRYFMRNWPAVLLGAVIALVGAAIGDMLKDRTKATLEGAEKRVEKALERPKQADQTRAEPKPADPPKAPAAEPPRIQALDREPPKAKE